MTPIDTPGNPIADGRSLRLDRAFRIIQQRPSGDDTELAAWTKSYEDEIYQGSEFPRAELVINLSLSEESAATARELLRKWMNPEISVEEMQAFIDESLGR